MVLADRTPELHRSKRVASARAARTPKEILAQLEEHPARLADLARPLSRAQLNDVRFAGTWTANDILAHLRCCADAGAAAVRGLAAGDGSVVHFVGPRLLLEQVDYRGRSFDENLRALTRGRGPLLALLRSIPPRQWSRDGRTNDGRATRDRSILDYGQWLARHERRHLEQLQRFSRVASRAVTAPGRTRASSRAHAPSARSGRASTPTTLRRASTRRT